MVNRFTFNIACSIPRPSLGVHSYVTINPYKLIQTFFVMILKNILIFFKIRQLIGNKSNNPRGASFKENHPMTTARDALSKKKFEDTKGVFRNRRSNDGQYYCQKKTCKRRNNVIHNTTQKLKIEQQKPH
jgi:hypothetical protein